MEDPPDGVGGVGELLADGAPLSRHGGLLGHAQLLLQWYGRYYINKIRLTPYNRGKINTTTGNVVHTSVADPDDF